jgi:hypothetical protein
MLENACASEQLAASEGELNSMESVKPEPHENITST